MSTNDHDSVGTCCGPAHLLQLVHPLVDQGVCQAFGRGSADGLSLAIPEAVVDEVSGLSFDVVAELTHRSLQSLRRNCGSRLCDTDIKRADQFGYPFDRLSSTIEVAVPKSPMQTIEGLGDERLGAGFSMFIVRLFETVGGVD